MDGARSGDDRLPWLDAPRPAKPKAPRRARTPLFALLGLFLASAIAVMAYLAGRGTAPVDAPAPAPIRAAPAPTSPVPIPAPAPIPPAPIANPAPIVTTPAPRVEPVRAAPAERRATRPEAKRKANVRRSSARPAKPAPAVVPPNIVPAPTPPSASPLPPRRIIWPAQPFAGPRGRVIQLGAYRTQAQADAAWWRLARSYPYLTTLPRMVVWVGPSPGRARIYRVRLAASSGREARALCRNLHRIGRGCAVV